MKKKVVYLTHWTVRDKNKEYPHGYGFDEPIVEFPQDKDPAWVAKVCRENLSNDEFECYGVTPAPLLDGMFEVLGEVPELTEVSEETINKGMSIVYWNMAQNLTQEEFTKWITS
jgi:hypothetical protein